jgi:hypothetical protein
MEVSDDPGVAPCLNAELLPKAILGYLYPGTKQSPEREPAVMRRPVLLYVERDTASAAPS